MRRTKVAAFLAALLLAGTGCASKDAATPVVRTKIDYDSTRDGPLLPTEETTPRPGEECRHAWQALPRGTHTYTDASTTPPMPALCTPVVCTRCGLLRHECERRRRR